MRNIQMSLILATLFFGFSSLASAQEKEETVNSIGFRFASDFNHFPRANELELVEHWFSTGVFGVFWRTYTEGKGLEVGFNINQKGGGPKAFNFPVIMQDFVTPRPNLPIVGMTSIEMDLKVGPRFKGFHPKIGYVLGYRLKRTGFLQDGSEFKINPIYLQLPFGFSQSFATNWGAVGFGAFFELDVTNVVSNDGSVSGGAIFEGGRQHAFNLEVIVAYETRKR